MEAAPAALTQVRDRLGDDPVALWLELELEAVASLPGFFDLILDAAAGAYRDDTRFRRLERAADGAKTALEGYGAWIREQLPRAGTEFALGREQLDELIGLRAFDGLTADEILDIGWQQLDLNHVARRDAAAEIDPTASEQEVLAGVKGDHPATFDEALAEYQDVMARAKAFVEERGLATIPEDAPLDVLATPDYLRRMTPFAAYFAPAAFDRPRRGIYIVTPSVDDDPGSMLEHNRSSISNTSIHEAYPGHHLQLSAALERPTLTRLIIDAPEFVEGWGMYSEQMMREHGFDATPAHRMALATDAIWRACRIILDIRLHRGEIGTEEATDFLIEHTGFERPNAEAEVQRYTFTPTYQLSYLLGKVLILRLREDERLRLGDRFSLREFHDALLWTGSIPLSFHRRFLAGEGGGPFRPAPVALMLVIPSIDLTGGRSRLVWWPGASLGCRGPHRPPRPHRAGPGGRGRERHPSRRPRWRACRAAPGPGVDRGGVPRGGGAAPGRGRRGRTRADRAVLRGGRDPRGGAVVGHHRGPRPARRVPRHRG